MAIYNDLGFLSSIGQAAVAIGKAEGNGTVREKPGRFVEYDDDGNFTIYNGAKGWAHPSDRSQGWFVREFDNWDQVLLRNSKRRIKKLFKGYYFSRDFDPISAFKGHRSPRGSFPWLQNLKSTYQGAPGEDLLSFWKRRKLVSNPFDSKGALCKKQE